MDAVLQEILSTLADEFRDLPGTAEITQVAFRLLLAALLGGLIGWERERRGKPAGVRIHMLVAIGAALFVMVPQQAGAETTDITRVVQGLVAGVGFLGAGVIFREGRDGTVQGMTTAAGIWTCSAIGMTVGVGRDATAMLCTGLVYLILELGPFMKGRLVKTSRPPQ